METALLILSIILSISLGFQCGYFFHDFWNHMKMQAMFTRMQKEMKEDVLNPIQMEKK